MAVSATVHCITGCAIGEIVGLVIGTILGLSNVYNIALASVPNAMNANLVNPLYWTTMPISLLAAFAAAVPINRCLLKRGRGHALTHEYHL